jgi:hypothetical protein
MKTATLTELHSQTKDVMRPVQAGQEVIIDRKQKHYGCEQNRDDNSKLFHIKRGIRRA